MRHMKKLLLVVDRQRMRPWPPRHPQTLKSVPFRLACLAVSLVVALGLCATPTGALNIILNFDNAQSANPSFDSDQSGLISLFQFAEDFYQDAITTAHTLTINFWYQNLASGTIGDHDLVAHDGLRETEANIKIDSNTNWFIDPSPSSNLEFNMGQTLWRDISSSQQSDWYNSGTSVIPQTFEVGFTGGATSSGGANGLTDMLSVVLHEVGHALGMSAANTTTIGQTNDGDYDFSVFGQPLAVETANNSGDDNANIAHLENTNALMTPALPSGTRRLPSHTDLLAMASGGIFPGLDLPRREFYGGGNWNTPGNWSGNSLPQSDDDAFIRNADGSGDLQVGLSANGFTNNLTVSQGADVDTNGFKLDASNIVTVDGAGSSIVIDTGGELEANQVQIQNGALISMLTGTLDTNTLLINSGTKLFSGLGNPTVDVATSLTNNGTIQAILGTMTMTSLAANPWNLDGIGSGVVDATGGSINIISGGLQGNSFSGTMKIGQARFISIPVAWSLTSGGQIDFTGGADFANRARIEGAQISLTTSNSVINAGGVVDINTAAVINNGVINTAANADLNFNGTTTIHGGVFNVGTGGVLDVNGALTIDGGRFFTPGPTATGHVEFDGPTTYNGGTIDLSGIIRQRGNATVNADTTVNGGYFDLDGSTGLTVWTINKPFRLNNMDGIENTANVNKFDGTLNINNAGLLLTPGGVFTVDLLARSAEWNLAGTANLDGSVPGTPPLVTGIPTMLAGSKISITGTLNMQDRGAVAAPINLTGTINTADADSMIYLTGGTIAAPNTIASGVISGPGTLASIDGHALTGFGTISAKIDFNGNSHLRADNGTLTVTNAILNVGTIGTADTDGALRVTNPWNTNVADQLELQGGSVGGANIFNGTVVNPGLIIGFGTVAVNQVVNDGRIAAKGGTLTLNYTLAPDLDGGGGNGIIEAIQGDMIIVDPVTDLFDGVATVGAGRTMTFTGGWTLSTGTLNLNGGASSLDAATVKGLSQTLRGTVNIDQIAAFDIPTTFFSTAQVNLPDFTDQLRLDDNATITAGASFSGAGKLSNTLGSTLILQDGANVGVRLDNNGLLEIGNSPGSATVAQFTQVLGTMHVELGGLTPGTGYDQLVVTGPTTLFGSLDIDLIDGLTPDYFDEFQVLIADSRSGQFTTITGATIAPDMTLAPVYDYNGVIGLTLIAAIPGDANLDGIVNGLDLLRWQANLFSGNQWDQGDFNIDGLVNGLDLLIWQSHLFDSVTSLIPSPSFAATLAVPEPSTLSIFLLILISGSIGPRARRQG